MSRLALFYLGAPRIESDGQSVDLKLAKAKGLLFYLAANRQAITRESLAAILWPDYPQDRAQTSLRSALLAINTAIGREWLAADRKTIRLTLGPSLWIDGEQYVECLTSCRTHGHPENETCPKCRPLLSEAANLYRDDFLAGLVVRDSAPFEDWQNMQAEHLRRQQSSILGRLARSYAEDNQYDPAIAFARRWVAHDRWDELAHHYLIDLYWRAGQRGEALRQYQACVEFLEKELSVGPSEELVALYRQIQGGETRRDEARPLGAEPKPAVVPAPTPILTPPTSPAVIPPITTSSNTPPAPENMQAHLPPFVGREAERSQIEQLLRDEPDCRLVMVVGPGGIGKTRLARQIADEVADSFPHGMAFVSLAPVSSVEFLLPTMARALKFAATGEEDLAAQLVNYLHDKQMLLVLDNLEHLLESADLLETILETAPGVKILGTSQERLNLRGEWLFNLVGLDFPEDLEEASRDLESFSAAQLFLQTARRVKPGFAPAAEDRAHIARICQLVDGMPLGVELAATWVRLLSCAEIAKELQRGLSILETNLRNVPERHRSLRAVFDHSWRLLSPEEQRVFRRMAVFRGGFQPEAAEQVAGATLPMLLSLADRGLVRRRPGGRYNRHPLLWQYTADKLNADLQEVEDVRDRHCTYYTTFLAQQTLTLKGPDQKTAMEAIEMDLDNLREAWSWAVLRQKVGELAQAVEAFYWFYDARGWYQEGEEAFGEACRQFTDESTLEALQAAPLTTQILVGQLFARRGVFFYRLGQPQQAREALDYSLQFLHDPAAKLEYAFAMARRALVLSQLGEFVQARDDLQESLVIYQPSTDVVGLAYLFKDAGAVLIRAGDYEQAQGFLQTGLGIIKAVGEPRGIAQILNNLGVVTLYLGRPVEARVYWEECLEMNYALNDTRGIASTLNNLGMINIELKHYAEAIPLLEKSLALLQSIGYRVGTVPKLDSLGHAACGMGDYATAHRYFREALRITLEAHAVTDILEELMGEAMVFQREGQHQRALELVDVVVRYPKSAPGLLSRAERMKADLQATAPDVVLPTSLDNVEPDLEAVVTDLLAAG